MNEYKSIALVDLSYLFKKNWHGVPRDAAPGAAAQMTLDQLAGVRESVDHVVVCLDAPPYLRKQIDPEYKAQREKPSDEELSQKRWLLERIEKDGYCIARAKGHEADDVIATLCLAYSWCPDVRIIGADKDCAQCVTENVRMFVPGVGSRPAEVRGPVEIRAKYGVDPKDMGLWLALVGDTSDNIPGVPGIGPKKASELIQNCVNLVGISEAMADAAQDENPGKMWVSLAAHWEDLERSVRLTALVTNVPVDAESLLQRKEPVRLVEDDVGDEPLDTKQQGVEDADFVPISNAPEVNVPPPLEPPRKSEPPPKPTTALSKAGPVTEDLQPLDIDSAYRLAKAFHNGRMYQKYPSPEALFTVIVKARELGLKVTAALDAFSVIQGVPRASADLIQALCERDPDCEYFKLVESTPERAVYRVKRRSHDAPFPDFVYTMDDARTAGLSGNANYKKNPAAMLRARCKSSAGRAAFPGAVLGLYCPEELDAI